MNEEMLQEGMLKLAELITESKLKFETGENEDFFEVPEFFKDLNEFANCMRFLAMFLERASMQLAKNEEENSINMGDFKIDTNAVEGDLTDIPQTTKVLLSSLLLPIARILLMNETETVAVAHQGLLGNTKAVTTSTLTISNTAFDPDNMDA